MGLLMSFLGHLYGGWWPGLLISVILAVFNIFGLVSTTLPYLRGQQLGESTLSIEQVAAMQTVANEFQIFHIAGSQMLDTGVYQTLNVSGSEFSRSYYGLLVMGERLLLVNTRDPVDETLTAYRGRFIAAIDEEVMELLAPDLEEHRDRLLPVYFVERHEGPNEGMEFFMSVQILLFAISLFGLWRFLTVTVFAEPTMRETPTPNLEPLKKEKLKIEKPRAVKPKPEKPEPMP